MLAYAIRRLVVSVPTLLVIVTIAFFMMRAAPGGPFDSDRVLPPAIEKNVKAAYNLDLPLWQQYGRYLVNLLQGDLGRSYIQKSNVSELIASRLGPTLLLMAGAIFLELVIGLTAGVIAAVYRGRPLDNAIMVASFVGVSAPQFVVGILLLYVFAVKLEWFPIGGYGSFSNLVLPALTLGILGGGWYSRMTRSSMIDVLRQDYIRTGRAKGASEARVVLVHALRNAILPIIAMIGLDIGIFMSGVVVVESVFGWPGIGQLAWQAIQRVDIPIIMGVTLVAAIAIVLGNLLADIVAPFVDPRIRLR